MAFNIQLFFELFVFVVVLVVSTRSPEGFFPVFHFTFGFFDILVGYFYFLVGVICFCSNYGFKGVSDEFLEAGNVFALFLQTCPLCDMLNFSHFSFGAFFQYLF